MDDRALVAAMVRRDPAGLDGVYRRYADRLYAYCVMVLRDADAAADAVQETLLLASERAGQLRDPERLRPWLYAIARHECLRLARARRRSAPLDEAGDVAADPVDAGAGVHARQLRELIGAASASLSPSDREVIDLSVRHGLDAAQVGAVLGVSSNHAHARMSRARGQLQRALGALLVARSTVDCVALRELRQGWGGQLTPLLRKRISRHIEQCDTCSAQQREQLQPAALLSAYAGLAFAAFPLTRPAGSPPPAPPPGQASASDPAPSPGQAPSSDPGPSSGRAPSSDPGPSPAVAGPSPLDVRWGRDGFPRERSTLARRSAGAAAVLLLLLGGGTVAVTLAGETLLGAPQPGPGGSAAVGGGLGPGLAVPSSSPSSSAAPSSSASTVPPSEGPSDPQPTSSGPPALALSFVGVPSPSLSCSNIPAGRFTFGVTVQATAALSQAVLFYRPKGATTFTPRPVTPAGTKATWTVTNQTAKDITYYVVLQATDGRTYTSPQKTAFNPCPTPAG